MPNPMTNNIPKAERMAGRKVAKVAIWSLKKVETKVVTVEVDIN